MGLRTGPPARILSRPLPEIARAHLVEVNRILLNNQVLEVLPSIGRG